MLLSITEKAADKVKQLATKAGKKEALLRIQVQGGGCSGLTYQFGFADSVNPTDKTFEEFGIKVVVDPKTLLYVAGSKVDYAQGLMKSGFKMINPNATVSCSCGESFGV